MLQAALAFIGLSVEVRPKDWLLSIGSFALQVTNLILVLTLPSRGGC